MKSLATLIAVFLIAGTAKAETINVAPNVYEVTAGVEFTLGNTSSIDYTFNWSDASGTFTNVADPTLILRAGQTYTFRRVTSAHPFVITDATLPVTGSDGNFNRSTFSGSVIDAATLQPLADFTADPAPTADFIAWTPATADVGTYYYTCRVTSHPGMTGAISVSMGPVATEGVTWSNLKALYRN
jgi:plastocyanin